MASVFNLRQVTQQVLGPRAEVPRSTLPLQTAEDLESRLLPTRRPSQPRPHSHSPAPPFTSVGEGGSEGCSWCAREPSRLPEKQPGHSPDAHSPGSQDAGERAPQRSARRRKADWGACARLMPLLERAATELVTGTEDSDARLRPWHFPAPRSSAPPKAPALREGETLAASFALPPPRPSLSGRGAERGAAHAPWRTPGLLLWERLPAPASRLLPRGSPASGIPELPVSTSTSRYLRIRPSCGGKSPYSHVWGAVAIASSCSARLRPSSKSNEVLLCALQLGGNNPLTAVLRPCPAEDALSVFL